MKKEKLYAMTIMTYI